MLDLNTILDVLTLILLAVGGYGVLLFKTGTETAIKTSTEEAIKAAVHKLQWPELLAQELQKSRGVARQEHRYKSYGALWKELRPLAIYENETTIISKKVVSEISSKLSDWYFGENGGLLLTPQARDFYFALQDLLQSTSSILEEWDVDRSVEYEKTHKGIFHAVLTARMGDKAINEAVNVSDYFSKGNFTDWENEAPHFGKQWRNGINKIALDWSKLDKRERFATLQQVGSILRTSLINDLESRLR